MTDMGDKEIGTESDIFDSHKDDSVKNNDGQTNGDTLPFYYQRLLNSLILTDVSDLSYNEHEDLLTKIDDKEGDENQDSSVLPTGIDEYVDVFSLLVQQVESESQEADDGILDASWMTLSLKTNGILGLCGMLEKGKVEYDEKNVDIAQERARKEGPYDQINAFLRVKLHQVTGVDHEVNQKIANLWRCISDTNGVMGIRKEGELRKHREYEKNLYIKWEKYLKKMGMDSCMKKSGAASLTLMTAPAPEQGAYTELPW